MGTGPFVTLSRPCKNNQRAHCHNRKRLNFIGNLENDEEQQEIDKSRGDKNKKSMTCPSGFVSHSDKRLQSLAWRKKQDYSHQKRKAI